MKPNDRLKEIENKHETCAIDMDWLIERVKHLTEALEFCAVINMPSKAVSGDNFLQQALEDHCDVARKALEQEM